MGKSSSVPQFLAKIDAVTREVGENRHAVEKTAQAAKVIFIAEAAKKGVGRAAPPGDAKSLKVGASYSLRGGQHDPSALVRYTGPAHLLNNPTKPHAIRPRKFVGTRGSGARAQKGAALLAAFGVDARSGGLNIPGVGVRRVVQHPGTKGLKFAQKAADRCKDVCPKVYRREGLQAPLRKVFK